MIFLLCVLEEVSDTKQQQHIAVVIAIPRDLVQGQKLKCKTKTNRKENLTPIAFILGLTAEHSCVKCFLIL